MKSATAAYVFLSQRAGFASSVPLVSLAALSSAIAFVAVSTSAGLANLLALAAAVSITWNPGLFFSGRRKPAVAIS